MGIFNSYVMHNYGSNPVYTPGIMYQPRYTLSYDLMYKGRKGVVKQSWCDPYKTFAQSRSGWDRSRRRPKYYYGEDAFNRITEIYFEIPDDQYLLKIFAAPQYLSWLYKYHPYRTLLGDPYLDSLLITLEKPAGRIARLITAFEPFRRYICDMQLSTPSKDPVTSQPRMKLRITTIIEKEDEMLQLFDGYIAFINKLYQPSFIL